MKPITYAHAGVNRAVARHTRSQIRLLARRTFTRNVLTEIGGFGGLFRMPKRRWRDPVLVSSCDGVGTKLRVAFLTGNHRTVGADLVNHCVNDIAVGGADPLFFLDYLATGRLESAVAGQLISGVAEACQANGCSLLGGETAEMPGFYADGEYDLAGFIVGVVERRKILDGSRVRKGHLLLGIPSTGLHTNGYSLARKLLLEQARLGVDSRVSELEGTVGEELLRVHRSYLQLLRDLQQRSVLAAAAHITGGGLTENVPRVLPRGLSARISLNSWPVLPIFRYLQRLGAIAEAEMLRTFNMGIGLVLIVPPARYRRVTAVLERLKEVHYLIGRVVPGKGRVEYK